MKGNHHAKDEIRQFRKKTVQSNGDWKSQAQKKRYETQSRTQEREAQAQLATRYARRTDAQSHRQANVACLIQIDTLNH